MSTERDSSRPPPPSARSLSRRTPVLISAPAGASARETSAPPGSLESLAGGAGVRAVRDGSDARVGALTIEFAFPPSETRPAPPSPSRLRPVGLDLATASDFAGTLGLAVAGIDFFGLPVTDLATDFDDPVVAPDFGFALPVATVLDAAPADLETDFLATVFAGDLTVAGFDGWPLRADATGFPPPFERADGLLGKVPVPLPFVPATPPVPLETVGLVTVAEVGFFAADADVDFLEGDVVVLEGDDFFAGDWAYPGTEKPHQSVMARIPSGPVKSERRRTQRDYQRHP